MSPVAKVSRVLVGVDFDDASASALKMAGVLASTWDADFDLIVVGTHRRHGARRWWLGSVAEAVVRRSPRPVLVVPAGAGVPEARGPITILAAGGDAGAGDAWVEVLKECVHPVLFVPSTDGIVERSTS